MTTHYNSVPAGLAVAHTQVRDELTRADTKASVLLSLVGATLAGVVALTGRAMRPPATIALWASALPTLVSVLLLIAAIQPRLHDDPAPGSWVHAARVGPGDLLEGYTQAGSSAVVAAHDVCVLARIALMKYRRIQAAVWLLVMGLGVLAVALVLSVVTR